jgi:Ca2+-binding RTX toxin-like protein
MNGYLVEVLNFKDRFTWISTSEELTGAIHDVTRLVNAQRTQLSNIATELRNGGNLVSPFAGQFAEKAAAAEAAAAALAGLSSSVLGMLVESLEQNEIDERVPPEFDQFLVDRALELGPHTDPEALQIAENALAEEYGVTRTNYEELRTEVLAINTTIQAWDSSSQTVAAAAQNYANTFLASEAVDVANDVGTLITALNALRAAYTGVVGVATLIDIGLSAPDLIGFATDGFELGDHSAWFSQITAGLTTELKLNGLIDELQTTTSIRILFPKNIGPSPSYSAGFVDDILFVTPGDGAGSVDFDLSTVSTWSFFDKVALVGTNLQDNVTLKQLPLGQAFVSTAGGADVIKIGVGAAVSVGQVTIDSGADNDTIELQAGTASVTTGAGEDTITLNEGDDFSIFAGGEKDLINLGLVGNGTIIGGEGVDTVDYSGENLTEGGQTRSGVTTNISTPGPGITLNQDGNTHVLIDVENIVGSNFDDRVQGDALANTIEGREGNDVLIGGDGVDKIYGGAGSDLLIAGKLTDTTGSSPTTNNETVIGGAGSDYIVVSDSGSSEFVLNDGDTNDHLLLMPHMVDRSAGADGSLPLFALTGGVALLSKVNLYTYTGGFIQSVGGDNIALDENDVEYQSYGYVDTPLTADGGGASPDRNWTIEYRHYEGEAKLVIVVSGYTGGEFRLTINGWQSGDYGITLKEFLVAEFHQYDDNSKRNYVTYDIGAANAAIDKLAADADRYQLTPGLELQTNGLRMAASAASVPELTIENLGIQVSGTDGVDQLTGTDLAERFLGQDGNDRLYGMGGDDRMAAGLGNDLLRGGLGSDVIDGGDGIDTADYRDSSAGVSVNLLLGEGLGGTAEGDVLANTESLQGSQLGDVLIGDDGVNRLYGNNGGDSLQGGLGNDILVGGAGADQMDGGDGGDTADYRTSTAFVAVDLAQGTGGDGDTLTSIEYVQGSQFADVIVGEAGANRHYGNDGDDTLNGGDGNDLLIGGKGADAILGGSGTQDAADYRTAAAAVSLSLATGGTAGEALGDTFSGIEFVYGSSFNDSLAGDALANRLVGSEGDDTLSGENGNDTLIGEEGDDKQTGGAGSDLFVFGPTAFGNDVIVDFAAGVAVGDRVSLRGQGVGTFADVQLLLADSEAGAVLTLAGGTITFAGVSASQFAANDFVFA